jgi:hypothetical protein
MLNDKIVVGGRVTGIHRIADTWRVRVDIHIYELLWVQVWIKFCLADMDSQTIYPYSTHPIAIPSGDASMPSGGACTGDALPDGPRLPTYDR